MNTWAIIGLIIVSGGAYYFISKKNTPLTKDGVGVAKFLIEMGYSKENAAGISGNLYSESKYNPIAVGDNGYSFGIAQWHKERWVALNDWAKKNQLNANTIEAQLKFIDYELKNTETRAYRELIQTKTPYQSAYSFAKYYERPKFINPERMMVAEKVYNSL